MERSGVVKLVSMGSFLMMMLLVMRGECGKSRLDKFMECYEGRYSICALLHPSVYCAAKAMAQCSRLGSGSSESVGSMLVAVETVSPKQRYCELGCALSRCINISTRLDPKGDEVGKCFECCSEITCKPKTSNAQTSGNDEPKTKTTDEQTNDEFCKLGCAKSVCGETAEKDDLLGLCGSCTTTCS